MKKKWLTAAAVLGGLVMWVGVGGSGKILYHLSLAAMQRDGVGGHDG